MKYIVTLFWAFVIGQVAIYIGGALTEGSYHFTSALILSLVMGVIAIAIGSVVKPSKEAVTSK
jgi:uncharacterized membrane protein YjjP (DUF1212 family)